MKKFIVTNSKGVKTKIIADSFDEAVEIYNTNDATEKQYFATLEIDYDRQKDIKRIASKYGIDTRVYGSGIMIVSNDKDKVSKVFKELLNGGYRDSGYDGKGVKEYKK